MQKKAFKIFAVVAVTILMMCGGAFAGGSKTTNPTIKLTDTTTPKPVDINPFYVTEVGKDGFSGSGYFRLVIPSSVAIQQAGSSTGNAGGSITRDTTTLGSKAAPKALYVEAAGGTSIFLGGTNGSNYGLMKVYSSGGSGGAIVYGSADAATHAQAYVKVAAWKGAAAIGALSSGSSAKVGEIYYDDTADETVITLAGATDTSASEKIWFNGIYLKPTTAGATGSVNLSTLDKDADGNNGIGITDDTTVKVLNMTDQPMYVEGSASGVTPPTIPAGKVAGQPTGRIFMTFVGGISEKPANANKITITLDNGAKFHTGAASILGEAQPYAIQVAGTDWSTWHTAYPSSDLSVNSSGALVITLGTPSIADTKTVILPDSSNASDNSKKAIIDTSGVTASGDINAKVTGSGTNLAKLDQTVKIATVAVTGTTVAFKDESPSGLKTLYTGRKGTIGENIPDSLLIGENAPGSLLSGGLIQVDLNLGAKFAANDSITASEYKTSPYADSSLDINDADTAATASSTFKTTVKENSKTKRGAYTLSGWSFDLTNATPGALQMTVSGNAGAAGTVTMATVIDATDTTVAAPPTLVPGSSAVTLGDITITENHYGALITAATDNIVIHFPTGITLDTNATVTVTSVGKTSGASSTSAVTGTIDSKGQDLYLDVKTASTSTSGPYTMTISGLVANISSSIGSGDADLTITGYDGTSKKGANEGAKPTAQTVKFATVVSSTVPYIGTPVVSGTAVTQTFIPAGNDINKTGDVYVFTSGQYYTGTAWSATEAAYKTGETLDKMSITYDVNGLPTSSKIYIGYGVGMTGTFATMNSNATFVMAYTTPSSVETGTKAGDTKVSFNVKDDIELNLNITNDDGVDTANIKQEWLVFGATANGIDAGLFFFDGTDVVPYTDGMDLTTVTYKFDHSKDYIKVSTLNMDALGLQSGDTFWYGYVYSENGIDLADPTTYSLENIVTITAK